MVSRLLEVGRHASKFSNKQQHRCKQQTQSSQIFSAVGVIDNSTDWKHLETDDHADALLQIGVEMTQNPSDIWGLELFTLKFNDDVHLIR